MTSPLTPEQAAKALGISRARIYELIRAGELAAFRIEYALRIEPKEIERFKAAHRVTVHRPVTQHAKRPLPKVAASQLGSDRYVN